MGALFARFSSFWNNITGPARRLIIFAAVIAVVGLALLFYFSGGTAYSVLVTGAAPADAAKMTEELSAVGIPVELDQGGSTIKVPADQVDQARLTLAQGNLLGTGSSGPGFELFDNQGMGATEFTQQVDLVRAMQGELERTISELDPVNSATVNIAMPQEQLFTEDQKPTTASVVVSVAGGQTLSQGQVRGISNLVSKSVPGLTPENITITDSNGNILNSQSPDGSVEAATTRMQVEAAYEREAQAKLDAMLTRILGPGKAATQVSANLNLDRRTVESETFDKESVVPLAEDRSTERLRSNGTGAAAAAGTATNTPGTTFPGTLGGNGNTNYNKDDTQVQNGVNRERAQTIVAPGTVVSQSISVQVADDVPAAQIPRIQNAVEAAVGFQANRDQISVQAVPFAEAEAAPEAAGPGGVMGIPLPVVLRYVAIALGVLLLLFFVRRGLKKRQALLEESLPGLADAGGLVASDEAQDAIRQLQGQRKTNIQQQVEDLAQRKPEDVAQLLRGWLMEGN